MTTIFLWVFGLLALITGSLFILALQVIGTQDRLVRSQNKRIWGLEDAVDRAARQMARSEELLRIQSELIELTNEESER